MGEIMIIMAGYKTDPIKRSKLRMTVYFNVRRLFPGKWILEKIYGNFSEGILQKDNSTGRIAAFEKNFYRAKVEKPAAI